MKKLIAAAIVLTYFNAATFAQAVPKVKKTEPSKMQVVKKTSEVKMPSKVVALKTTTTTAVVKAKPMPAKQEVKTVVVTKPAVMVKPTVTKVNSSIPLKKDGTPDKRYTAKTETSTGPVKKDGTPDMRYKVNKKH